MKSERKPLYARIIACGGFLIGNRRTPKLGFVGVIKFPVLIFTNMGMKSFWMEIISTIWYFSKVYWLNCSLNQFCFAYLRNKLTFLSRKSVYTNKCFNCTENQGEKVSTKQGYSNSYWNGSPKCQYELTNIWNVLTRAFKKSVKFCRTQKCTDLYVVNEHKITKPAYDTPLLFHTYAAQEIILPKHFLGKNNRVIPRQFFPTNSTNPNLERYYKYFENKKVDPHGSTFVLIFFFLF